MRNLLALTAVLALLGSLSSAAAAGSARSDADAINAGIIAAYLEKDSAKIASFYSEDAEILPPRSERSSGKASIEKMWRDSLDGGVFDLAQRAVEVVESGDFAYEVGVYEQKVPGDDGKTTHVVGKFVQILMRQPDGSWRIHREIWNADSIRIID